MNLRETKGWSYGVYSQVSGDKERLAWVAVAPVQADRTGDSIKEFRSELTAFLNDKGTTPAELERTINSNVRALPGSFETSDDVLGGIRSIVKLDRKMVGLGKGWAVRLDIGCRRTIKKKKKRN